MRWPGKPEARGIRGRAVLGAGAALALGLLPALLPAPAAVADSISDQQNWVFTMMHVQDAWNVSKGSGVTVAVLDTGVDGNVSDLQGNVIGGKPIDYTQVGTSPDNPNWGLHGTWMASIIAGHGNGFEGSNGITGVAPKAKILSVRVIPDTQDPGYSTYDNQLESQIQGELAKGIVTAVKDGAKVISMSIGYSAPSSKVRSALQFAYSKDVVLVASAGNSGDNATRPSHSDHSDDSDRMAPVSFPAEYPGVISVGAVTSTGAPTSFSSGNLSVKVAAPGKKVPAQGRSGQYYSVDGTSPACALVAGVAALIESAYKGITPAMVTEALTTTTTHKPPGGYGVLTGFGIVDASAALTKAGQLMKQPLAKSQVPLAAHFGGGTTAQPAAPVAPRGEGGLIGYLILLAVSAVAVLTGGGVLLLTRRARP